MSLAAAVVHLARNALAGGGPGDGPTRTELNIARYATADAETISHRLEELDLEWDLERTTQAFTVGASLLGVVLGRRGRRAGLLAVPIILAGGFLLQRALRGSGGRGLVQRLGFRTRHEIDAERYALRALRGDFKDPAWARAEQERPQGFLQQLLATVYG